MATFAEIFSSFDTQIRLLLVGLYVVAASTFPLAALVWFFVGKQRFGMVAKEIHERPWISAGLGVLLLSCTSLLLFVFPKAGDVGAWLGLFTSIVVWAAAALGYAAIGQIVTQVIMPKKDSLAWLLLGCFLISILQAIPLIGPLFFVMFCTTAIGGAAIGGYAIYRQLSPAVGATSNPGA